jgi:probable phosphoglycerate mutase
VNDFAWLGIVRHGQSVGNEAADRAEATGSHHIDIDRPDAEVPLTEKGREQASAIGTWLGRQPVSSRPTAVVASPYRRAADTARLALDLVPDPPPLSIDERLRDRELGILDRLTAAGVAATYPEEEARRRFLGKFYYRPPGGESWADVALRLRSLLSDLRPDHPDGRILLVSHEAVVFLLRYLIDGLPVPELLELARRPLANAGLTTWVRDGNRLELAAFDDEEPLQRQSTATRQPNV